MKKIHLSAELPPLEPVCAYLLALLRAALEQRQPPALPAGLNWGQVCEAAQAHRVENMAYAAARDALWREDPPVARQWEERCRRNQEEARAQQTQGMGVIQALAAAGIPVVLLKGLEMREYYPQPEWRQMDALGLFVEPEELSRAEKVLEGLGFERAPEDRQAGHYRCYAKAPCLRVEFHTRLVPREERQLAFFTDPWPVAGLAEEQPGIYGLYPNAFYLYMMDHLYRHYGSRECCIRSVLDVYLYRRAREAWMDPARIRRGLKKLRLVSFAREMEDLARCWFGSGSPWPVPDEAQDAQWNLCYSCLWGAALTEQTLAWARSGNWAPGYLLRRIFPGWRSMDRAYPVLRRWPLLLPLCWLFRLVTVRPARRGRIRWELTQVSDREPAARS